MASNHSEEQPRNVPNVTIVLGGGNRGRTVHKVKMVHLNSQTAAEEQMKAEQQQKEKIKQQRALQEKRKNEICQQLCMVDPPQVVADGYAARISWKPLELMGKQYSEKLKRTDSLPDLVPSDTKITYNVKMVSKDKTVHNVYSGIETCCVINDLKPGGQYSFSVTASIGEFIASVPSPEAEYSLPPEIPSTPTIPKIATKSKSSVTIRWNSPSDNGAAIVEYSLEWSVGSDYSQVYSGKEKQFKVNHKFTPGSQTRFRVRAKNEVGWSEFSDSVTYTCAAAAPEAPPTPECVAIGVKHVTVRWSSPDDNGAIITSYKLEMEDEDTGYGFRVVYQGEETEYSCKDLHRHSNYKFRVCAVNSAGTGAYSPVAECTTLPDLPGCPLQLCSKERPTTTTIHIQWSAPQDDGGSSITGYKVEICKNLDETFREVYHGEARSCEIKGLAPGTSCKSRVCAVSAGGKGPWTDVLVLSTKAVCPDATGRPRVKGKPKQESVTITWDPPVYNGGAVVKFYNIMKKQKDKWLLVAVVQDSAIEKLTNYSYTITKLAPGMTYFFSIVCQNDAGKSTNSEALEVVTAASSPDTPPKPFILCNSPTSANVKWEQPADNGDKIVSYNMKWSEDEDDDSPQTTTVTSGRCYVIKNLSPATTYGCSIQAVNSIGCSNWSSWSSFTTQPSSPGTIQHCKVMSKSCSTLVVYWTKPQSNGSPVTAYHIELNGKRVVTVTGALTEAALTNLAPQTDYKIRVQSENKVGVGPFSSTILVTTLPLPPAPPTLQLQAANQNSLKLTWHRKQDKGYTYILEMRQANEKYKVVYEGTAQSHRITRLLPNSTYTFRVCSTNESGKGDWSNPTSFGTTEPLPFAPKVLSVTKATSDSLTFNWKGSEMATGNTIYELQLRLVSSERDFTQVYKGSSLSYTALSLPANSTVEARVRAIRQATTKGDQLFSPFTDVKHRTLQSAIRTAVSEEDEDHDEATTIGTAKSQFALTEKQIAFILFMVSVLLTLLVALGIGYWTM